jgi:GntR family transcriptional regulator
MHIAIDPDDARPVFRQIVDEVRRCVATGILKSDDPLPAVRELAKALKVNPNTVQQAYRELERSGGAYVRRGVGTFVARAAQPSDARRPMMARQLAGRFLREGFRHGLLASDLLAALQEIAPRTSEIAPNPSATGPNPPETAPKPSLTAPKRHIAPTSPETPQPGRLGFDREE